MDCIYLDYNATTFIAPEVSVAMTPYLATQFGNPSSAHAYGQVAQSAVNLARTQVAAMLGAHPDEIVLTGGGTEANNLALIGVARALREKGRHLITTAVEHPAVTEVMKFLESEGWEVTTAPVDHRGQLDPATIAAAIRPDTVLISLMHANNEVGTILPVRAVADLAHRHGILVHTDAAQSIGKIPVRVPDLGVDLLSVAGHKLYAPKGVGALYVRAGTPIRKIIFGAGQENGLRPGTENTPYIVALGAACRLVMQELTANSPRYRRLRDRLQDLILSALPTDTVRVNGDVAQRLPNTLSLSFRQIEGDALLRSVPQIAASTGAACHAGAVSLSSVLQAMQVPLEYAKGTIRLSVGRATTESEVDRAAELLLAAVRRAPRR